MKIVKLVLSYIVLIVMSILIIFPLFVTVMAAFNGSNTLFSATLIPENFTLLGNFKRLFSETEYLSWYRNTFAISLATMVIATIFITVMGFIYSRLRFKSRRFSLVMLLVVQVIPAGSTLIALFAMAKTIGVYDGQNAVLKTYMYIILIYATGSIPMNTLLMKGYYDSVPRELDESARIDGASTLRIFREILFPLVLPMVVTVALFAFMAPIGDVIMPNILISDPSPTSRTLALGLNSLIKDPTNSSFNLFAAGSILIAVPVVIMFFYLQRFVVSGLTSGGVKG